MRLAIYAYVGLLIDVRRLFTWKKELFGVNLLNLVILGMYMAMNGLWPFSVVLGLFVLLPPIFWRRQRLGHSETFRASLYEMYIGPFLDPQTKTGWYSS